MFFFLPCTTYVQYMYVNSQLCSHNLLYTLREIELSVALSHAQHSNLNLLYFQCTNKFSDAKGILKNDFNSS